MPRDRLGESYACALALVEPPFRGEAANAAFGVRLDGSALDDEGEACDTCDGDACCGAGLKLPVAVVEGPAACGNGFVYMGDMAE